MAIIVTVVAVAIPLGKSILLGAAELAVVREMQAINQAQVQYQSQFGGYAASLAELGPPVSGIPGPKAAKLIPASLASGEKDGYVFDLRRAPSGFTVHANPKVFGSTGRRTFYLDEDGIVRQNWGPDPAGPESPEFK